MENAPNNPNISNPYRPYADLDGINGNLLNPYLLPKSSLDTLEYDPINSNSRTKHLLSYALMKYLTTALASPFEVAQTLLQVQHLELSDMNFTPAATTDKSSSEEDSEEEDYNKFYNEPTDNSVVSSENKLNIDGFGYLTEEENNPFGLQSYHLKPVPSGVWSTIKALIAHPDEGLLSLWKGQFTYWIYDMAHFFLQPSLELTLNDAFDLYDDTIPLQHLDQPIPNLLTLVTSNLVVGLLLNPLELIRTRLIVQSSSVNHKKYHGPIHGLMTVIYEEGWQALYSGPDIYVSGLYHLLNPLIQHSLPLLIDRVLHVTPSASPFTYSLLELLGTTVQLMITLPLDTVRKRLQLDSAPRANSTDSRSKYTSVVPIRKLRYSGAMDCAYRVAVEAMDPTGVGKNYLTPTSSLSYQKFGLKAFYRGFSLHTSANAFTSAVSAFTGIRDDGEW